MVEVFRVILAVLCRNNLLVHITTEFLLIGLQQQLTKIHNCSLNTTDSARNLGFIFDCHLTFSFSHLSLSLVVITFVNFVVSAPILTSKLPVPLPHLLFTLSLITATLCTSNVHGVGKIGDLQRKLPCISETARDRPMATFRNLKQVVFRLFRTLLPGLWLRLPNSVTTPKYKKIQIQNKNL